MARTRVFKTSIALSIAHGEEREISLILRYEFTPGYPDTREEPGQSDSVEITSAFTTVCGIEIAMPTWLMSQIEADETLAATLTAEARESDQADADDAAERRHDELRDEIRATRRAA